MPRTLTSPGKTLPDEPAPPRKRWTRHDCERLERAGLLPERYELLYGEIYDKVTVNPRHSITLLLLASWLEQIFGRLNVRTQDPIRLPDQDNKPEPDVAVMRKAVTAYLQQHPAPEDLLLVAEVSDTTLAFDLKEKARLYACAGISEYWVIDIAGRRAVVHRQPATDGYREINEYAEEEWLSTMARPEVEVRVADLLPPIQTTSLSEL